MAGSGMTEACRLCLLKDIKLIPIDVQFENSMRSILGQNITYESGLPKYICNDCANFLKCFKEFKDRCLRAQTVLYQILKTAGQVTDTQMRQLNRKRLKLDMKITPQPNETEEPEPTEDIPLENEPIESVVKEETLHLESETMEESESETEDKSKIIEESESESEDKSYVFEGLEEESEVLLDATNPLEVETDTVGLTKETKRELILPPEHADLSEGFNIFQPPINALNVVPEPDQSSDAVYHCERCCHASYCATRKKKDPQDCPHGAGDCLFEFPTIEEYNTHSTQHRTYKCRRCSCSATDVEPSVFSQQPACTACAACGACCDSRRGLSSHGTLHKSTAKGTETWDSTRAKKNCKKKTKKTKRISKVSGKRKVEADLKLLCRKCDIQFSTTSAWRRHVDGGHVVNEYEQKEPRKKRKNYSNESLKKAFDVVTNKEMSIRAASRVFKIPRTTLQDRIRDGHFSPRSKRGPPTIFSEEEEGVIVEFVKSEGRLNRQEVIEQATVLAKQVNRERSFKNGKPGMTWYMKFLRRHPELQKYGKKS